MMNKRILGRPRIHVDATCHNFYLPGAVMDAIDRVADARKLNRSQAATYLLRLGIDAEPHDSAPIIRGTPPPVLDI